MIDTSDQLVFNKKVFHLNHDGKLIYYSIQENTPDKTQQISEHSKLACMESLFESSELKTKVLIRAVEKMKSLKLVEAIIKVPKASGDLENILMAKDENGKTVLSYMAESNNPEYIKALNSIPPNLCTAILRADIMSLSNALSKKDKTNQYNGKTTLDLFINTFESSEIDKVQLAQLNELIGHFVGKISHLRSSGHNDAANALDLFKRKISDYKCLPGANNIFLSLCKVELDRLHINKEAINQIDSHRGIRKLLNAILNFFKPLSPSSRFFQPMKTETSTMLTELDTFLTPQEN